MADTVISNLIFFKELRSLIITILFFLQKYLILFSKIKLFA